MENHKVHWVMNNHSYLYKVAQSENDLALRLHFDDRVSDVATREFLQDLSFADPNTFEKLDRMFELERFKTSNAGIRYFRHLLS